MSQGKPEGRPEGSQINITMAPSTRIGDGRPGVYVGCTDHYAIRGTEPSAAGDSMELLESSFEASLNRSERIIDHIVSLVSNREAYL